MYDILVYNNPYLLLSRNVPGNEATAAVSGNGTYLKLLLLCCCAGTYIRTRHEVRTYQVFMYDKRMIRTTAKLDSMLLVPARRYSATAKLHLYLGSSTWHRYTRYASVLIILAEDATIKSTPLGKRQ